MHIRLLGTGLALLLAFATGLSQAHEGHDHGAAGGKNLPKCPVMGEETIDLSIRLATADGPVYFCCNDCIEEYKADPGKYAAKAVAQRKQLANLPKVQVTCPVMGGVVDKKVSTTIQGQKILFCCKGCIGKFEKNPAKYAAALANSYTYQTKCPVMGGTIDPKAAIELVDGRKIYFCCAGCDKKLAQNPEKYLPKLAAQGVGVSAKDLAGAKSAAGSGHRH